MLFSIKSTLLAQDNPDSLNTRTENSEYFKKGTSQIGLEHLSLGFGYGRIFGSTGFRYGYFIADNNLLFINGLVNSNARNYQSYKIGLNYRHYFSSKFVKPFAQVGINHVWENYSGSDSYGHWERHDRNWEGIIDGGAVFQVKKFGFEIGLQMSIREKQFDLGPKAGISFSF